MLIQKVDLYLSGKQKQNDMKTLNINLNGRTLKATIEVLSMGVFITTEFDGFKRSFSANSIKEAITKTTIAPLKDLLKTL